MLTNTRKFTLLVVILTILLVISIGFSLINGSVKTPLSIVYQAITAFEPFNQVHQVLINVRLPRVLGAAIVGASLAASGALMQGITQNPLADSGLLGINAGAGFGLALMFAFFPSASYGIILAVCFLGAAFSVWLIYAISQAKTRRMAPLKLTLAGAGISAFFVACSQALALQFNLSQDLVFWSLGGVSAITWFQLRFVVPFFVITLILAWIYSPAVTLLRFGDDVAASLGNHPKRLRLIISLIVLILSGLSVSIVGSISFVGLVVPHLLRYFVGDNYRYLVPLSSIGGAVLVVWSDLAARLVNPPFETPFGAVIALIGIPFFIYLARRKGSRI